jgi:glycopeptide antibiotics resistance protein
MFLRNVSIYLQVSIYLPTTQKAIIDIFSVLRTSSLVVLAIEILQANLTILL